MTESLAIVSKRVVLGGGAESLRIEPACVVFQGSRIQAIGPAAECPAEARTIDVGERLVTPAFINAHTHLALGCLRGVDLEEAARGNMVEDYFFRFEGRMSPEDIRAFARMGAYESLLHGVGLVWDHYYHANAIAAALAEVGLCGVVAPTLQDIAGPGKDVWQDQLQATAELDADATYAQKGIFAALGPHATDTVSASLFKRAMDLAAACDLPLHAHLAQSVEEHRRAFERHGQSPVAWLKSMGALDGSLAWVFAHCLYLSRADLEQLAAADATAIFCPYSQLIFGHPAPVGAWSEAGVSWAVATDCSANNDTMNVQQELRMIAAQRTVGTPWSQPQAELLDGDPHAAQALWERRCALQEAHRAMAQPQALLDRVWARPGALHNKFRAGVLEPGALANAVVWDTDHPALWPATHPLQTLAMADTSAAIWAMFVAGKEVGQRGDFHRSLVQSADYLAAQAEAKERLARLLDRDDLLD